MLPQQLFHPIGVLTRQRRLEPEAAVEQVVTAALVTLVYQGLQVQDYICISRPQGNDYTSPKTAGGASPPRTTIIRISFLRRSQH